MTGMLLRRISLRRALGLVAILGLTGCASGLTARPGTPPVVSDYVTVDDALADVDYNTQAPVFRLRVGDEVGITFYEPNGEQFMKRQVSARVLPDGTVTPPLLNPVPAAQRTVGELRDLLVTEYAQIASDPSVTVTVESIQSERVFVMGEVGNASAVSIHGNTSVLQALAMAGGILPESARMSTIRIVRPRGDRPARVFTYDADAVASGRARTLPVRGGDIVFVHPTDLAQWSRSFNQAIEPLSRAVIGVSTVVLAAEAVR